MTTIVSVYQPRSVIKNRDSATPWWTDICCCSLECLEFVVEFCNLHLKLVRCFRHGISLLLLQLLYDHILCLQSTAQLVHHSEQMTQIPSLIATSDDSSTTTTRFSTYELIDNSSDDWHSLARNSEQLMTISHLDDSHLDDADLTVTDSLQGSQLKSTYMMSKNQVI